MMLSGKEKNAMAMKNTGNYSVLRMLHIVRTEKETRKIFKVISEQKRLFIMVTNLMKNEEGTCTN